jgi:hypothetical protein
MVVVARVVAHASHGGTCGIPIRIGAGHMVVDSGLLKKVKRRCVKRNCLSREVSGLLPFESIFLRQLLREFRLNVKIPAINFITSQIIRCKTSKSLGKVQSIVGLKKKKKKLWTHEPPQLLRIINFIFVIFTSIDKKNCVNLNMKFIPFIEHAAFLVKITHSTEV